MGLSCYLLSAERLESEMAPATTKSPVFLAHGHFDNVLPFEFGQRSRQRLEESGYSVAWHEYPMAHSLCGEQIADIGRWLRRVLP
jgi:phospholipase/carboxylesterase